MSNIHLHSCPECYQKYPCDMDCSIEPDLEDPTTYPGYHFGAHCICDKCEGQKEAPSQEWFARYNGVIR